MNYLVTGGLGYMGSWITRRLLAQGHDVHVLSRRTEREGKRIQADITALPPEELAARLPAGLDGCVHTASCNESFVPGYAEKALLVNGYGTRNLLEALLIRAEQDGTPPPLTVYCSTFHVYGRGEGGIDESCPPNPRNDYALTHLFGEQYCRFFGETRGLPQITIRCTNGYGAPVREPFDKWYLLLNDLCRSALTSGRITLRSDPAIPRDFVWMGDVAWAVEKLLARADLAGGVFNVSGGKALSIGTVARLVAEVASRFTGTEIPLVMEKEASSSFFLEVSHEALRRATGFTPHDMLREELTAILEFLAINREA